MPTADPRELFLPSGSTITRGRRGEECKPRDHEVVTCAPVAPVAVSSPPHRAGRSAPSIAPIDLSRVNSKQKVSSCLGNRADTGLIRGIPYFLEGKAETDIPAHRVLRAGPFRSPMAQRAEPEGDEAWGPYPHFRVTSSRCSKGMPCDNSRNSWRSRFTMVLACPIGGMVVAAVVVLGGSARFDERDETRGVS